MTATAAETTEAAPDSRGAGAGAGPGPGAPNIINNQSVGNDADESDRRAERPDPESESESESSNPPRTANLTAKLLQATTGNMRNLLNRTLSTIASASASANANPAQHVPLPAILLQAVLDVDVTQGQRIDQPPHQLQQLPETQSAIGHQSLANATSNPPAGTESADIYSAFSALPGGNMSGFIESSTTAASSVLSSTLPTLPATSSMAATFQAQTVATFIAAGNKNRPTTIVVYPTASNHSQTYIFSIDIDIDIVIDREERRRVRALEHSLLNGLWYTTSELLLCFVSFRFVPVSPESIVIPIVSCIFGFPILALIVICCLRRRAKLARERDRRRNYDMQDHAVSLLATKQKQQQQQPPPTATPPTTLAHPQSQSQSHPQAPPQAKDLPASTSSQLLVPPQLRKTASVRESHDSMALAKRRSRLQDLRAASTSSGGGDEAAVAFSKRGSKRGLRRGGATASGSSSSSGSPRRSEAAMRKSQSLDAAESYSLASIQSPLWVTLTNARTIEELAQQKL
ncbi:GL26844 [Drosophila persimilis]|uniref:GL26844 n=1 Tax=Drosophila persimilis TaxID=7234 RepID=B4H2H9_DROPE|nr:GL26844 [Drosophila persimilis]